MRRARSRHILAFAIFGALVLAACGGSSGGAASGSSSATGASGETTAGGPAAVTLTYSGNATSQMGSGSMANSKLAICAMDPADMQDRQFRVRFSGTIPDAFDPNKTDAVSFEAAGQHLQFVITATGRASYVYNVDAASLKSGHSGSFDTDMTGTQPYMGILHIKGTYQC